jgi:hypothetical protein
MLKPPDLPRACAEFQRHYEGGRQHEHLASCAECRRFVEFVDGLRRLGLAGSLGDDLRARLRGVPEIADPVPALPRVPELPLPAALRRRLRRIARRGIDELPIWIRSPRYAIAASYVLTLLIGGTVGNPAVWAGEASSRLERAGAAWAEVRQTGRETWLDIGETANESFVVTRDYLWTSGSALRSRWIELVESIAEPEADEPDSNDTETNDDGEADRPAPRAST